MPSRSERIYLCPDEDAKPGWKMPFPPWWNRSGFFEKFGTFNQPGSRWFDTGNPWYVDYALLLSMGEAAAWDEECRKAFTSSPAAGDPKITEAMRQLKERLSGCRWVIVESYEWESGLD